MAYTAIDNPELYFQNKLYTGNGGTNAITLDGSENLSPNFVWIKNRNGTQDHHLFDTVRGTLKRLESNSDTNEETRANSITSYDSDGFTLGDYANTNTNNDTYVAWNWKAGTSVSGNTSGGTAKAYSGSVNTDAGISIITYLGNDNSAHVVPHHLGVAPELTIIKERSNADIWVVQNSHLGFGNYMTLHTTNASTTTGGNFITSVSSSAVTMNENAVNNANDESYILYSFASKQGYSKIGTYKGNGNADGTFIYTGFKPAWVMIKRTNSGGEGWSIFDNKRSPHNVMSNELRADVASAEATSNHQIDFLANGFKPRGSTVTGVNGSGDTYLYYAVAEASFVNSNGVPATAR